MNSAKLELARSNPKSGIVTIWPYYRKSLFLFLAARETRFTAHACIPPQKREAVMTDMTDHSLR